MTLPGGWSGRPDHLEKDILDTLAVDDYFIANYARPGEPWVNFYSAWYDSQSGGQSTHSPRTCIPGGGWAITELEETTLKLTADGGAPPLVLMRGVAAQALERADEVAHALELRGYGNPAVRARGGRARAPWSRHDVAFAASTLALLALAAATVVWDGVAFEAYPRLESAAGAGPWFVGALVLIAALAPFLQRRGIAR